MAASLPTTTPARHVAGTSLEFTRAFADYPAPAWTLSYALVAAGHRITFTGADNGDGLHLINVAAASTAAWAAGRYEYQATVSNGSERITVETGTIQIFPDFAAQTSGYDGRSHARKVLDAIEATLEGRATESHSEVQIGTPNGPRRVIELSPTELLKFRNQYMAEVSREIAMKSGKPAAGRMRVRF